MTSVFNGKIRRWYIKKSDINNCSNEQFVYFGEFKPNICDRGFEWIPVISLDDFHKEVNINISRWVEVAQELAKLREENEKLKFQLDVAEAVLSVQVTRSALAYFEDKIKSLENNVTEN